MDDYISRKAAIQSTSVWNGDVGTEAWIRDALEKLPAADVRPVVTCERCVYHVDCGYHYCNKWCVKRCPDDADFFCAYGEEES